MKIFTSLYLILFSAIVLFGQDDESAEHEKLTINSSFTVDNVFNLDGGIDQGYRALGLFDFNVEYTPSQTGIFQNTSFYVHLLKTAGDSPSGELVGDAQGVANTDGYASRFIYEALVKQQFGDFNLTLGLHDLNTEFMASDYAGDYINSSFGIFPTVSLNVPVSIFPVTTMGGVVSYNKKAFDFAAGFYNLNYEYGEDEKFKLNNNLFETGCLGVGEFRYRLLKDDQLSGEYKVGAYFKHYTPESDELISEKSHGFYFIADQVLWTSAKDIQLGMFAQASVAPEETEYAPDYYGLGLSVRTSDKKYFPEYVGLALASVALNSFTLENVVEKTERETAIELSFKKEILPRITIQPDLQYIINPSAMYANAVVGIVRVQVELNK